MLGDAAEKEPLEPASAVGSHGDQIGILLARTLNQRRAWLSRQHPGTHRIAFLLEQRLSALEADPPLALQLVVVRRNHGGSLISFLHDVDQQELGRAVSSQPRGMLQGGRGER